MDTKIFVFLLYIEITKKKKKKKKSIFNYQLPISTLSLWVPVIINYQSQPYCCGFQLG